MKKYGKNLIIIGIVTLGVIYFALKDDLTTVVKQLFSANPLFVFFALVFMITSLFAKSGVLYLMTTLFKKNYKFNRAFKLTLITQLFHGITPLATGGQPAQVYYLKKDGIPTPIGTTIVIQSMIVYNLAITIIWSTAIIINQFTQIFEKVPLLRNLVIVGFLANLLLLIFSFVVSFKKNMNKKVTCFLIKLLSFKKTQKQKEKTIKKWETYIDNFHEGAVELQKNKPIFIKSVLLSIAEISFRYLVPSMLIIAIAPQAALPLITVFVATAYVLMIGAYVPIPGGSGGIEFGFATFYGTLIAGPTVPAVLLLWRFITYYLVMIVGALTMLLYKEKVD